MNIILIGAPGVGKGSHASLLTNELSIPHISTGDMFRANLREGTALGQEARRYIDAGNLVPDSVVIAMVQERLTHPDTLKGFILDGFPRTVAQAEAMQTFARVDMALNIVSEEDVILKRLTGRRVCRDCQAVFHISRLENTEDCPECGGRLMRRKDDDPETVSYRLSVYQEQTKPLIDYYQQRGLLKTVQANGSLEEDHVLIREALRLSQ